MQEVFLQHLEQNKWAGPHQRILLTVSGGLDSMVMLHLFASAGFRVSVAHCNFQLRADESDSDEQFVAVECKQLQIPFYSKRFATNNYATEKGISTQMAARDLRYAWFNELAEQEKFDFIATAHHLNDAVETTLLNLISGRGLDGFTGIPATNGRIIRPLLFATRTDIENYAADYSIAWREDSSNQSDDYKRNFIRHQVIPQLKQLNPGLEESISRSIRKNKGILELKKQGLVSLEAHYLTREGERVAINKSAFDSFRYPEAVLYEMIRQYGFALEHCDQIIAALRGQSGKNFLSATHQLVVDRHQLIITPHRTEWEEIRIVKDQKTSLLGTWRMEMAITSDCSISSDPYCVSFDAGKVIYPLTWRLWKEGDFFYPLGMNNKKKISDFLIDTKVAMNDKATITVLESKGEIMWVTGHRISHHFRITSETKQALCLKVLSHFV